VQQWQGATMMSVDDSTLAVFEALYGSIDAAVDTM
jgi:hypothetical protein